MRNITKVFGSAALVIGLAFAASAPAEAALYDWSFSGTFTDGATATGQLGIDVYGSFDALGPTSLQTTASAPFIAHSFGLTDIPSPEVLDPLTDSIFVFTYPYDVGPPYGFVHLEFASPLYGTIGPVSLLTGTSSYECIGFETEDHLCPDGADIRYFESGVATNGNSTQSTVPEPMTLSLFGAGLAGLGATRRRKKQAA